jgi:hypothetical protein
MSSVTKGPDKRAGDRRANDRRKADLPFGGKDRRQAERRTGRDRRA